MGDGEQEAYEELQAYTLQHGDPAFLHQHVVDAWAAQHAREGDKPICLAFALIGLHLQVDRGFTGRRIQQFHMALAWRDRVWPSFPLPAERGSITALDVMAAAAGKERDRAIHAWCASVWEAYGESHRAVAEMAEMTRE